MNTNEHKSAAAALGLEWSAVLAIYREMRELEAADVARRTADRRDAYQASTGDANGGRWKMANRAALNGGDSTYVQGLDVTAADRGMSADEMFDELAADAPALRSADDVMCDAIDRAAELAAPAADVAIEYVGLVAAAAAADITEQWLRQLVKTGKVRGIKVGRNWKVAAADVAFFARHPTAGRPRARAHMEPAPF